MQKGAYILSFSALEQLRGALNKLSAIVLETIEKIHPEFKERIIILENRLSFYMDRLSRLQRSYDVADDEDRRKISYEIERAEEDLREIRYWIRQIKESHKRYMFHARNLQEIATNRTAKANCFLNQKLSELQAVIDIKIDS